MAIAPPHSRDAASTGFIAARDGVRLAYDHHPASGRAPLLFAHGFGQTRLAWTASAQRLAEAGHPGLRFDARGHGDSDRNPVHSAYCPTQLVDDLEVLAGQARPVLVGASMGGLSGLMAQARSRCFSALVLVDVTPRWETAGVERILGFMSAHPDGFESLEAAADAIAAYLPHRAGRKSPDQLRALLRADARGRWQWHWDPRLLSEFAPRTGHLQAPLAEAARTLDIPVLLVSGGRSDIVSGRTVEEFLASVPHAEHAHLPEATHMVAGDDNDAFTAAILPFLSRLPATGTATPGATP